MDGKFERMELMINMNSGYSGYSMSNNAVNAYENGEMPLSKWTKDCLLYTSPSPRD